MPTLMLFKSFIWFAPPTIRSKLRKRCLTVMVYAIDSSLHPGKHKSSFEITFFEFSAFPSMNTGFVPTEAPTFEDVPQDVNQAYAQAYHN